MSNHGTSRSYQLVLPPRTQLTLPTLIASLITLGILVLGGAFVLFLFVRVLEWMDHLMTRALSVMAHIERRQSPMQILLAIAGPLMSVLMMLVPARSVLKNFKASKELKLSHSNSTMKLPVMLFTSFAISTLLGAIYGWRKNLLSVSLTSAVGCFLQCASLIAGFAVKTWRHNYVDEYLQKSLTKSAIAAWIFKQINSPKMMYWFQWAIFSGVTLSATFLLSVFALWAPLETVLGRTYAASCALPYFSTLVSIREDVEEYRKFEAKKTFLKNRPYNEIDNSSSANSTPSAPMMAMNSSSFKGARYLTVADVPSEKEEEPSISSSPPPVDLKVFWFMTINNVIWTMYGLFVHDQAVIFSSLLNFAVAAAQLAIYRFPIIDVFHKNEIRNRNSCLLTGSTGSVETTPSLIPLQWLERSPLGPSAQMNSIFSIDLGCLIGLTTTRSRNHNRNNQLHKNKDDEKKFNFEKGGEAEQEEQQVVEVDLEATAVEDRRDPYYQPTNCSMKNGIVTPLQ